MILGIDTSNYKTSVALVNKSGEIIFNHQQFLEVKKGERGLRQQEALFQHVNNLPDAINQAMSFVSNDDHIEAVSVSVRPRPVEGSYMPCFNAGYSAAKIISSALGVPLFEFSHQEGHFEAVNHYSIFSGCDDVCFFHFSGGTTEAVFKDEIIGGTKDISFGQVLDRVGVTLGLAFPCGNELDQMAISLPASHNDVLTPIKVKDCWVNLSGIETQSQNYLQNRYSKDFVSELFEELSKAIVTMTKQIREKYDVKKFLFSGGVSSSQYIRNYIENNMDEEIKCAFGDPSLSSDNAVGIALLGGKKIWL